MHANSESSLARLASRARPLTQLLLGLASVVALGLARQEPGAAAPTEPAAGRVTLLIVRHAETAASTLETRDPDLSEAGRARAAALDALLANADVSELLSSPYARTRQTLAPLAERQQLEVAEYDPRDAGGLAARLRALPAGSVAVVAGHSNTVPALVRELCADWPERLQFDERGAGSLPHDEHGRLYAVTLERGAAAGPGALLELQLPAAP